MPHLLLLVRYGIVQGRPALVVAGIDVLPDGQEVLDRLRVAVPSAQQGCLIDANFGLPTSADYWASVNARSASSD